MKVNKDDFVIFDSNARKVLGQVLTLDEDDDSCEVVFEKNRYTSKECRETVVFSNLILNLGAKPHYGSVYGNTVEPLLKSIPHDFGTIMFHTRLKKSDKKVLMKSLDRAYSIMHKAGLTSFLPIDIKICTKTNGKYVGWYKTNGEDYDTLTLRLKEYTVDDTIAVLIHELGHGVMFNMFSQKLLGVWTKLYARIYKHTVVKRQLMSDMLSYWSSLGESYQSLCVGIKSDALDLPESFNDQDTDGVLEILDSVLTYIETAFNIKTKEFSSIIESNTVITQFLPDVDIVSSYSEDILTEYASKNRDELFAEAFRLHFTGSILPKTIAKYMKKTLTKIK